MSQKPDFVTFCGKFRFENSHKVPKLRKGVKRRVINSKHRKEEAANREKINGKNFVKSRIELKKILVTIIEKNSSFQLWSLLTGELSKVSFPQQKPKGTKRSVDFFSKKSSSVSRRVLKNPEGGLFACKTLYYC